MIGDLLSNIANAQKLSIAQLQQSIQDGTIPQWVGIPMLQKMVQERQQAAAMLAGQQVQGQPPINQQVMQAADQVTQTPQQPPLQMAQAAPQEGQGIDAAESNLPQEYAGGGIVAFQDNEDQPVSADMPSNTGFVPTYSEEDYFPRMRPELANGWEGYEMMDVADKTAKEPSLKERWEASRKRLTDLEKQDPSSQGGIASWFLPTPERIKEPLAKARTEFEALDKEYKEKELLPKLKQEYKQVNPQYKEPPAVVAPTEEKKKAEPPIVIHRDKSDKKAAPAAPAPAPAAPAIDAVVDDSKDPFSIANLYKSQQEKFKGIEDLIKGDEAEKQRDFKTNLWLQALRGGFKMMGGKSPYGMVNIGEAGEDTAQGIAQVVAQQQAEKARQTQQLVAMGLKGVELDTELKKLGITKDHYDAQKKLFQAQADEIYKGKIPYYLGRAHAANTPKAAPGGSVSGAVVQQELDRIEGFKANPKSAPFFAQLPPDVQTGLTKYPPTGESYKRSMQVFTQYAQNYAKQRLDVMRSYGQKQPQIYSGMPDIE